MAQSPDVRLVTEARLPALAEELGISGSGSGSGIGSRLVSGGVEFPAEDESLPPFVVATTTGATVEGVSLAAGQMAAFWYLNGAWHVMVHGQDTVWRSTAKPDTRTAVNPAGPTFTNAADLNGGTWTTPSQAGIRYSPMSGTASKGQVVTVTATLSDSTLYRFATGAKTSWTYTFPDPTAPVTDTFQGAAGAPLAGRPTETGGMKWAASTNSLTLTGDGAAAMTDVKTYENILDTAYLATLDASIDYDTSAMTAGQVFFGFDATNNSVCLRRTGAAYFNAGEVPPTAEVKAAWAPTGTIRVRSDGTTVSLYINGVLATQKALDMRTRTNVGKTFKITTASSQANGVVFRNFRLERVIV